MYLIMFERLKSEHKWTRKAEARVRGTEFQRSDYYYMTRKALLEKIIGALSQAEIDHPTTEYVRKAIQFNALDLAQRSFERGISQASEKADWAGLLDWFRLRNSIKVQSKFNLQIPSNIIQPAELLREITLEFQLEEILTEIRGLKAVDFEARQSGVQMIRFRLDALNASSPLQTFEIKRLTSRAAIFQGKLKEALRLQESLVDSIDGCIPHGLVFEEIALLSRLQFDAGNFEAAQYWSLKLSQWPCESVREEVQKKELWIRNTMILAEKQYHLGLAKRALDALAQHAEHFSISSFALHFYFGAVIAFANQDYRKARSYVNRVRSIRKSERPGLHWPPELLRCLIDLEEGEDIDSALRSTKRIVRRMGLEFPMRVLDIIKSLFKYPFQVLPEWKMELLQVMQQPDELRCSYYFDAVTWINSKAQGITMAEADAENRSPKIDSAIALL